MESITEIISDSTKTLFTHLGYEGDVVVEEQGDGYVIQVNCEDTGILIGYHGQTLAALQTILSHILFKKTNKWIKATLNVSDYWQKREEQLKNIANRAVEEVRAMQSSSTLPCLSARERRFVHMLLGEIEGIHTESVGEGGERRLVVFPN